MSLKGKIWITLIFLAVTFLSFEVGYEKAKLECKIPEQVVNIDSFYSGEILFHDQNSGKLFRPQHELKKIGSYDFVVEYNELHTQAKIRLLPNLP